MGFRTDAERNFGFLIHDLARLLRRNLDRRLQSLGLTQAQWRAIVHLSRSEGMTQIALADSLEVQAISLARLIDRMQNAGWVERRSHPLDRRAVQLYLTAKCQPILEQMEQRAAETLAEALDGIQASSQKQAIDVLQRIKQNLLLAEGSATSTQTNTTGTNRDGGRKTAKLHRTR